MTDWERNLIWYLCEEWDRKNGIYIDKNKDIHVIDNQIHEN